MKRFADRIMDMKFVGSMDKSREELCRQDRIFGKDREDLEELERRFADAEISRDARLIINDYIACMRTVGSRYADLSYLAGLRDAVRGLAGLGLVEDEEQCLDKLSCKISDLW